MGAQAGGTIAWPAVAELQPWASNRAVADTDGVVSNKLLVHVFRKYLVLGVSVYGETEQLNPFISSQLMCHA